MIFSNKFLNCSDSVVFFFLDFSFYYKSILLWRFPNYYLRWEFVWFIRNYFISKEKLTIIVYPNGDRLYCDVQKFQYGENNSSYLYCTSWPHILNYIPFLYFKEKKKTNNQYINLCKFDPGSLLTKVLCGLIARIMI
jgi:hypothetical protein